MKVIRFALVVALWQAPVAAQERDYLVYVVSEATDEISLIRFGPAGARVERTRTVGFNPSEPEGPHGIAVAADRRHYYVSTAHGAPNGHLWKFTAAGDTLLGQVELGAFPASLQVTPDGHYAYVVNFNLHGDMVPSSVSVVGTAAMQEVARIETCAMPHGSRLNSAGTLHYSACMMNDLLVEIDTRQLRVARHFMLTRGQEHGMTGAPGTGRAAGRDSGHGVHAPPPGDQRCSPTWAAPSPDGRRVYVACNASSDIVEIDVEKWTLTRRIPAQQGVYNVALTRDGKLLIATNKRAQSVSIIEVATGTALASIRTIRPVVHGIAISDDDRYAFISVEGIGSMPGTVEVIDLQRRTRVASVDVGQMAAGIDFLRSEPAGRARAPGERERPAMVPCPWPVDSIAFKASLAAIDTTARPAGVIDTPRRQIPDCAPPRWTRPDTLMRFVPPRLPADRPKPIVEDYLKYVVTAPPPELVARFKLDPTYYKKYADANGYPILASAKVSDAALAIVRDLVNYMLAHRPDIRDTLIAHGGRIGIMAETEYTMDIPEQRRWIVPKYLDPRLTVQERARYYEPGGLASQSAERYWNNRARGMGGTFTTCAEENVLGFYGTRYWGTNICVHEFAHGIMGGGIAHADPQWYQDIVDAYKSAKAACRVTAQGYAGNTFNEYWAVGVEWYIGNGGRKRADLKAADPRLYELVSRLIPENKYVPQRANVASRTRQEMDEYVRRNNPEWWQREQLRLAARADSLRNAPNRGANPPAPAQPPCVPQQ